MLARKRLTSYCINKHRAFVLDNNSIKMNKNIQSINKWSKQPKQEMRQ